VAVTATDTSNDDAGPLTGAYCASFTPDHAGKHFIMVMVGSAHVAGSPFRFNVESDVVELVPDIPAPPVKVVLGPEHYEWQAAGDAFHTAQVGEPSEFTLSGVLKAEFDSGSPGFVTATAMADNGSVVEYVEDACLPSLCERLAATFTASDDESTSAEGSVRWVEVMSVLVPAEPPRRCLSFKVSYVLPTSGDFDVVVVNSDYIMIQGSIVCNPEIVEAPSPEPAVAEVGPKMTTITVQMSVQLKIEDLGKVGDAHYLTDVQQALNVIKQAVASASNTNRLTLHRIDEDSTRANPDDDSTTIQWNLT
jgi:hypothetical protein